MLVGLFDLIACILHVLVGLLGILFDIPDRRILRLHDLSQIGEHSAKLRERRLDALKLIVASANGAED
jgi:hypothetical protein